VRKELPLSTSQRSVRDFYESFPCGGEEQTGDRRSALLPWWVETLALDKAEGRVLEIACGTGLDLAFLAESADEAVGLDGAQRPLRVAERRLEGRTNVRFSVGDAARLPFRDESFDGIWCIGALHHMPAWRQAVAEAGRVLRPGGTFRFLVYRRWALQTLVFAIGHTLRPLAKRRLGSDKAVGRRTASIAEFTLLPVVHLFPEQTWLQEVRTNGMQIEHVERRDAWFPLDRVIPGLAKSDALSQQLGRSLIVEACKAA
jgi:SAM-dependent methyltransferase